MTPDLHRLVYYSRNRIAGSDALLEAEIRGILAASRRNNPALGVTGALMFNTGCFAQVLEGPCAAVEHTFERIQRDARHGEVSLLSFAPASARVFERWSMAYVGRAELQGARYTSIAKESGFDPSRMSEDTLFETLRRLVLDDEHVCA